MIDKLAVKIAQNPVGCGDGLVNQQGICVPERGGVLDNTIFTRADNLSDFVFIILEYAFALAGIIAVIYIVIGGYTYLTAGGDEEKVKQGRKYMVNALIGLVLVLTGSVLVRVVANLISGGNI